jgi:hypothetical protein
MVSSVVLPNRYAGPFLCYVFIALLSPAVFAQQQQTLLGTTALERGLDSNGAGTAEAFPVVATFSGQVNSLSLFVDSSNNAPTIQVGVYANYYGHPSALMTQAAIQAPAPGQWNSVAVPPLQVSKGNQYWIALLGLNGEVKFRDVGGYRSCYSETSKQTSLTSLPASWWTGSRWSSCVISMFGSGSTSSSVSVSVSPSTSSLQENGQAQFTATVYGATNTNVNWSASGGTISASGVYTAPPAAGNYIVTATSVADLSKSGSARVSVIQPSQISITVSPNSSTLPSSGQQQFSATVSGSSNTAVTWTTSGGTVTTTGLYTAPPSAGTYTVTATSVADTTKSAAATVTVSTPVSVSLSPTSTSLQSGGQQQFSAYVSGTSKTAVTWSASAGTISTAGLYTAPSATGTYTVQAISVADPTKSASAFVAVTATTISVTISPTSTAMPEKWQQQFAATVSGTSNTAVTWAVVQGSGTITQSGLYTAPQAPETGIVTVTSQADTTKSASATVTVTPPHSVSLTWVASSSSNVSYYNVYRGTVSGGPYTLIKAGVTSTAYTDTNVQSGVTYFYVTTAVNSSGAQSSYSGEVQAIIPTP